MNTEILHVSGRKMLDEFISFPHILYRDCPQYVPQLNREMRKFLQKETNPFLQNADVEYFLTKKDGKTVGRIAAIVNYAHLQKYNDQTGFFGFFDAENDAEVARALLKSVADFLNKKGLNKMVGPESFSTNDSVGVLTKGFDDPPIIMMPYNYPYYGELLEKLGMKSILNLSAYPLETNNVLETLKPIAAILERSLEKKQIRIRPLDLSRFASEMDQVRDAYNLSNEGNWGFLSLSKKEFDHTAADMRQIIEPWNVLLAEKNGEIIGYLVSLPDFNQVMHHIPEGKLFPFGWWQLIRFRKKISRVRILILGVSHAYRGKGIDGYLYYRIAEEAAKHGIQVGEAGYVMSTNASMHNILKRFSSPQPKSYQLYEGMVSDFL